MSLFRKEKNKYPKFPEGDFVPVLKCSICNGEQVLCAKDNTGHLHELMLVRSPGELEDYCRYNGIDPDSIDKVY
ncbi:MAG: aspartate dehydrogenase [Mogibacterium sp.]|nr:aspartate dehydrogenase [Mogibacterium sp.]